MKFLKKFLSIATALCIITSAITTSFTTLASEEDKNLLWSDTDFSYSYNGETAYGEKFSKIVVNKENLTDTVNVENTSVFGRPEFSADEKPKCAANGHAQAGAFGGDVYKLFTQEGYDSVGTLIDLGNIYNVNSVKTVTVAQDVSSDWAKNVRLLQGRIYAGNDLTKLSFVAEFNNTDNTVSDIVSSFSKAARYVMIVYTGFGYLHTGCVWIDEIEVLGTEYTHAVPENHLNLVWSNTNFSYSYSGEAAYGEKFSKVVVNKENLTDTVNLEDASAFGRPEFSADEKALCAANGHAQASAFGGDVYKLFTQTGYDSVGTLIDLGEKYDVSCVKTVTVAQNVSSDWAKNVRLLQGRIYAGNDLTELEFVAQFNNTDNTVSDIITNFEKTARYVMIVYTGFGYLHTGCVWIDEIEVWGTEYTPVAPADHSNAIINNKDAITKLTMKEAVDTSADVFNATDYKSEWISSNFDGIGAAVDGNTTECSAGSGFKPTYQYTDENGEAKVYANIGWLIDLGYKQDLSVYSTYYWTDDSKIDTRKQKGIVYAGDSENALQKVAEFDNSKGKVSFSIDLSGVSARYVAVVLTNEAGGNKGFNWYGNLRTFMAEIELNSGDLKGDLNQDGTINILDMIRLKKHFANAEGVTINKNNKVFSDYGTDSGRLVALKKYIMNDNWN